MTRVDVGRLNQCQLKSVDMTLGTKFGQREMKMDHPPSQRLSVRVQLRIAFFLIFAAFLGVSLLVDNRMRIINDKSTEMAANWMPSIVAVNAINTATSDMRAAEALHILSNEDAEMGQQEELIARLAKEIADQRTKYKALISSEEERALYQSFTRKYDEYLEASKRSMASCLLFAACPYAHTEDAVVVRGRQLLSRMQGGRSRERQVSRSSTEGTRASSSSPCAARAATRRRAGG